jgi:hypothetical protein
MNTEKIAQIIHETYEHSAPLYSYPEYGELQWDKLPPQRQDFLAKIAATVLEAFTCEMRDAGKWIAPDHAIPPMSALSSGAISAASGNNTTTTFTLASPSLLPPSLSANGEIQPGAVVHWPPLPAVGESRVKAMIDEALAAAEDRMVERVFKLLNDRLRTRTLP